ncbi:DUF2474 family protein [Lysobacter solisilvae (ex Woo and Kim 2020)]|uniref:DUF2474 family protein n=1 Tax=Agrilutibacter terrestris TaxID=2865112 RepID=A0A7H0G1T8_9GAMM|nr:DUF2474 family protein [Lysobacter terrestris]QNP42254.1 DUF2474 family protein [Lysobacter terrestris]
MNRQDEPPKQRSRLHKTKWFVLLWAGGVLATLLVAGVFKLLMLGAVKQW